MMLILAQLEQNDPFVTEIECPNEILDNDSFEKLVTALSSNNYLKKLKVSKVNSRPQKFGRLTPPSQKLGMPTSAQTVLAIVEALKINASLRELDLSCCITLDAIGAINFTGALAEALKINKSLQTLSLSGNAIGQLGAVHNIAEALKINTSLQELRMRNASIGLHSSLAIAEALEINTSLQVLDLSQNNIGSKGILAISEALEINTSLQVLNLSQNDISSEDAPAIQAAENATICIKFLLDRNEKLPQLRQQQHRNREELLNVLCSLIHPQFTEDQPNYWRDLPVVIWSHILVYIIGTDLEVTFGKKLEVMQQAFFCIKNNSETIYNHLAKNRTHFFKLRENISKQEKDRFSIEYCSENQEKKREMSSPNLF